MDIGPRRRCRSTGSRFKKKIPQKQDEKANDTRKRAADNYNAHLRDLDPFQVGTPVSIEKVDPLGKRLFRKVGVVVAVQPKKM